MVLITDLAAHGAVWRQLLPVSKGANYPAWIFVAKFMEMDEIMESLMELRWVFLFCGSFLRGLLMGPCGDMDHGYAGIGEDQQRQDKDKCLDSNSVTQEGIM